MKLVSGALIAALISTAAAFAGPQYTGDSEYALSGYDAVSYFDLEQRPLGEARAQPLPGSAEFSTEHNGVKFAFASAENLKRFMENPDAFAPQYDGHCAFAAAKGAKAPANPYLWRIVDGQLYLNFSERAASTWEADIPGYLAQSEANWPGLEPTPAAVGNPPRFTAHMP